MNARPSSAALTPLDWMTDLNLCGRTFGGPTWEAGRVLVAAIFGLPMTPEMLAIYRECTARTVAPLVAVARAMVAAGRGSGKTLLASFVVLYIAASRNFNAILGPGELAYVRLCCPDRRQARVAFRYVRGLLRQSPMLEALVLSETRESITLSTGAVIEIGTASFRSSRGYSLAGVVVDECAFLPTDDAANPDIELVRALTPGLARVPGSLLLCISSPWAKRGVLFREFQRHHGRDEAPVLTWRAPTRRMNPTIGQDVIDEALRDDPVAARSEWLAEDRPDIETYVSRELLEPVVAIGRLELPPIRGVDYRSFLDFAGGVAGGDSLAWAIGHDDKRTDRFIVDAAGEFQPPFSPQAALTELALKLQTYNVRGVVGDRWGGEFPREILRGYGISYTSAPVPKSELYLHLLPEITARRVELPDHPKLLNQLASLERRTAWGGRESIDHAPRGHDDLANCAAGVVTILRNARRNALIEVDGGI